MAHVNYFHANFSTTLIGLFSVLGCCLDRDWTVYHLRIFCILEPLRLCREGNLVSLLSFLLLEREGLNTQAHVPFSFANFPRGHAHTKLIQYWAYKLCFCRIPEVVRALESLVHAYGQVILPGITIMPWILCKHILSESSYLDLLHRMWIQMLFIDGVFHADPHAGNLLLLPDGRLGLLDFGQVSRFLPILLMMCYFPCIIFMLLNGRYAYIVTWHVWSIEIRRWVVSIGT